jgi:hypothetical protein
VALIVKRTVGHAGFSPEEFSGHSLFEQANRTGPGLAAVRDANLAIFAQRLEKV